MTSDGPAVTNKPLCHACCEDLQRKCDQLPRVLEVLPAWKGGLRGEIGEAKVSASKNAPPCPLNVGVIDLIMSVEGILQRVGNLRIADLALQPGGPEWCDEIRWAYQEADKTIGIGRHWSRRLAPCPNCELRTLGSWAGEEIITCSSCGNSMDRNEYDKQTIATATAERRKHK
ncbi:hypothetical protein [Mycobacterium phage WXIN]|nr:hypothetical protein [Mycobacterium phage WXIN]